MLNIIPEKDLYLVKEINGYSPQIGRLICMMNYARYVTLKSVEGLTAQQLDYQQDAESNSIGALLLHIAATDHYYHLYSFKDRQPDDEDLKGWKPHLISVKEVVMR